MDEAHISKAPPPRNLSGFQLHFPMVKHKDYLRFFLTNHIKYDTIRYSEKQQGNIMRIDYDVSVQFYRIGFSRDEYVRFLEIMDQFNIDYNESPHDETLAVREISQIETGSTNFNRRVDEMWWMHDNMQMINFIVKSHFQDEWDEILWSAMNKLGKYEDQQT